MFLKAENAHCPPCFEQREIALIAVFEFYSKVLGEQDIDFDEDVEFSAAFVLRG